MSQITVGRVLILIVVDNGLVLSTLTITVSNLSPVLILIVVDNGLVHFLKINKMENVTKS